MVIRSESAREARPGPAGARGDDRALIRQQLGQAARSLLRPRAYVGAAKELALTSFSVLTYPLGMMPTQPSRSAPAEPDEPHPALQREPATADMPIVLMHGYVHNRSAFIVMSRALRRAGFRHVRGLNYNPLRYDVHQLASMLAAEVDEGLADTGASHCMIVGHSMGGIVARYYVQCLGGQAVTDTVVTLGAPHRGTYTAYLGLGPAAGQLKPRSELLRTLEETARPSPVRWISYYSDLDVMVTPTSSGKLVHPALAATNIKLQDAGHLSLLLSGEALRSVVDHLADRELGWHGAVPRPAPRTGASRGGRGRSMLRALRATAPGP